MYIYIYSLVALYYSNLHKDAEKLKQQTTVDHDVRHALNTLQSLESRHCHNYFHHFSSTFPASPEFLFFWATVQGVLPAEDPLLPGGRCWFDGFDHLRELSKRAVAVAAGWMLVGEWDDLRCSLHLS